MIPHQADAVRTARRATNIDPGLAHAYTILGFAELINLDYEQAEASFETAIGFDQAAPLPRLGLGLSLIRRGSLEAGRREIEIAVLLSPNDALVRSYVAKAYFDERRAPLSLGQLALAKVLNPVEPTAFLYLALNIIYNYKRI